MNKIVQLPEAPLADQIVLLERWREFCLRVAETEWERDFPLLRKNHSSELRKSLGVLLSFPVEEQLPVLHALISRRFPNPTPTQKQFADEFQFRQSHLSLDWLRSVVVPSVPGLAPGNPRFRDILDASHRVLRREAKKADFKKHLLPRLRKRYEKLPPRSSTVFETVTEGLPWLLETQFDLGGWYHFRVDFVLRRASGNMAGIRFSPGNLVGFGELAWDEVWPEELNTAAEDAVALCVEIRHLILKDFCGKFSPLE